MTKNFSDIATLQSLFASHLDFIIRLGKFIPFMVLLWIDETIQLS